MICRRLASVMLAFYGVTGCLLSTSANQERTGSSGISYGSGFPKAKSDSCFPTEHSRRSVAEANAVMRVRRSVEGDGGPGPQGLLWSPPTRFTASDNDADFDQRPRSTRNFMRFGRTQKAGNGDIICRPVVAEEEPEMTSAKGEEVFTSKRGDDQRFTRFVRDQGQYDYTGKPFMRFGRPLDVIRSRKVNVICFRANVEGEENGKKFIGLRKAFSPDSFGNTKSEDGAIDLAEGKRFLRFGKSSYPIEMESQVDYVEGDRIAY